MSRTEYCTHETADDRALTGTWILNEIRLAVEKDYIFVEVHEVYEYQVTQYDSQTGTGGLFIQYIDTFLKLKAEARDYPSWVQNNAEQDRYVRDFADSKGIQLDKDAIGSNPTKRGLAKVCLNSMWGKLTERNDRNRTKIISDQQERYRFLAKPYIENADPMSSSDDVVWASWCCNAEENVPNQRNTNQFIGAYVTAGA